MALLISRSTTGLLISATSCTVCAYLISDCNYPIDRFDKIVGMPTLEIPFCIISFDCLPTVKCSVVKRRMNRVLRVERGEGGRVLMNASSDFMLNARIYSRPLGMDTGLPD